MNVRGGFLGSFLKVLRCFLRWRIEKWSRSLKLQNCLRARKKITVEYLAWFMENILCSWYYNCLKNMSVRGKSK